MLTILAFGDEEFADVATLSRALGYVNVLDGEDPETGLDASYVPAAAADGC